MRSKPEGRPLRDSVVLSEAAELVTRALDLAYYQWRPGCEDLHVSPAMLALFGEEPGGWVMPRWLDTIHPNERAEYDAARSAFVQDGAERAAFTFRARIADGSYRWLHEQAAAERDADGRVAQLVGLLSDITKAKQLEAENRTLIARQAASEEVLCAISASLDDAQPVFALVARHARTLCGAGAVLVVEFDGTLLHMRALAGGDAAMRARLTAAYPRTPAPDFITGRAVLTDDLVHIRNMPDEPELLPFVHAVGEPSALGVPMRRAGQVVGAMVLSRSAAGGFDDGEVALIRSFAEQAAIALGSAATLAELRARTAELAQRNTEFGERIEQQSATIDVLKAMSRSPDATEAVFELITRRARELCNGVLVGLFEFDGEVVHLRSSSGMLDHRSMNARYPMRLTRETVSNRAILERRIIHIRDASNDSELSQAVRDSGSRSILSIPLMRDGIAIGAMSLNGLEPGGFSDGQVSLLQTFAEQAVIAIGSAEIYRELRQRTEALARRNSEYGERIEHQSATIDVLQAMSASPGDPRPVFDLIVRRALRACDGMSAALFEFDDETVHARADAGGDSAAVRAFHAMFPRPPDSGFLSGRAILERRTIHVRDIESEPGLLPAVRAMGGRTTLAMPVLRDGVALGAISLNAREAGGFSESQIELLRTFAEQAAIAIATAKTYRELEERTEALTRRNGEYGEQVAHQAATIDVLKAMSASPDDPQPVFDLVTRRACEICQAEGAAFFAFEDGLVHFRSTFYVEDFMPADAIEAYRRRFPMPPDPGTLHARAIMEHRVVHTRDIDADPTIDTSVRALGHRSNLAVPLLRDDAVVGVISLSNARPGGFSDSVVELLRTFAEQSTIAIITAQTYRALRERTEELARRNSAYSDQVSHQAATIDVLKVMSASRSDTKPVFNTILRRAMDLSGCAYGTVYEFDGELIHLRAGQGFETEAFAAFARRYPKAATGTNFAERAVMDRRTYHVPDLDAALPDRPLESKGLSHKAVLAVPLLRGDTAIGVIVAMHRETNRFTEAHIELLKTFAEQAVIAIDGTATFRALQERTEALGQRNEQQAATIEVLKVMSGSLGDAQPVFDLIVRRAVEFCGANGGRLLEFDGELLHLRALVRADGTETEVEEWIRQRYPAVPDPYGISDRVVLNGGIVHARGPGELLSSAPALYSGSVLGVPLLREGRAIGAIVLSRAREGGFSASQVELLQTFAEQAVIAIGSATTYRELQNRTEALTRSLNELQALEEVLRAVNSSLDLETVLSTIISRAVQLSRSDEGTIYEFDATAQVFVPRSAFGMSEERVALLRDRRIRLGETHLGRSAVLRVPVAVDDVQNDLSVPNAADALPGIHAVLAVPLLRDAVVAGGLVIRRRSQEGFAPNLVTLMQTFAGQAVLAIENARLFQEARQARFAAESTLDDLRRAQDRLVQSEKMASLGQLTAGIAHEIKNPLNFVNNFAELSVDLLNELHDAVSPEKLALAETLRVEIDELTATLQGNLQKIAQHGRRADSIVKNMLLHSRSGPGEHRPAEVNAVVEEALNLAYHGARAERPGFNITLETRLAPAAGKADMFPQEITRVMLNLIGNGFYAAHQRAAAAGNGFEPKLRLETRDLGDRVEIRVRDNGTGIDQAVRGRIFEPFFTTKPAGEGTGLGLSLSYDIVVKQHGGQLAVDSEAGEFTEFVITLPRKIAPTEGSRV